MSENIYGPTVEQATERQKRQAKKGKRVFLGKGRQAGWIGELPFYLVWCEKCKKFSVDYKHGFRPYLMCQSEPTCGVRFDF